MTVNACLLQTILRSSAPDSLSQWPSFLGPAQKRRTEYGLMGRYYVIIRQTVETLWKARCLDEPAWHDCSSQCHDGKERPSPVVRATFHTYTSVHGRFHISPVFSLFHEVTDAVHHDTINASLCGTQAIS